MSRLLLGLLVLLSMTSLAAKEKVYELTTAVSGVVQEIMVKPGEKVKKGQILLVLDQRVIKARHEAAKKSLNSATLHLAEVKKELERTEELYERTVISNHELELARVAYANAEKHYADAQEQLTLSEYQMEYSQLAAPVSGKIKTIPAWVGMVVNNQLQTNILITLEE